MVGVGDAIMLMGEIPFTPRAKKVLEYAVEESQSLGMEHIGTEHILLGLVREEEGLAGTILQNLGVTLDAVRESTLGFLEGAQGEITEETVSSSAFDRAEEPEEPEEPRPSQTVHRAAPRPQKSQTPTLDEYTRDLTALAAKNALDPVIGREDEIERLVQILARRTKNNPVLIGDPGVGKTAIVEGLAQKMAKDDISDVLAGKRLLALDLASVVAGTKYRGEFEQRLKNIIDEAAADKNSIIFIDELHTLIARARRKAPLTPPICSNPPWRAGKYSVSARRPLTNTANTLRPTPPLNAAFSPSRWTRRTWSKRLPF